jgi:hypothetical protein
LTLKRLAIALPVVFVVHVAEEAPTFVSWFNSLVSRHITQQLFLSVNLAALVITLVVALLVVTVPDPFTALVGVAWVGFLMLANGLFHIIGTVAHARYCPGVVTASLLYLPLSVAFFRAAVGEFRLSPVLVAGVAVLSGVPMYIHGFLIVFRGSRLF